MAVSNPPLPARAEYHFVVSVADFSASDKPGALLTTSTLGSSIGLTIYDPVTRVGGILHFMLPDSSISAAKALQRPAMFANTGIPALLEAALALKAEKSRLIVCLAGGAHMMDQSGVFNIAKRNQEAAVALLREHGLEVAAQDVGGMVSRRLALSLASGEVRVRTSAKPEPATLYSAS